MMSIGEFAQLSGLTIKALRHYDERGLLVPAQVDPDNRYRTYAGSQLRDAVMIKALRDAGVPVDTVRRALSEPDQVDALLAEFGAAVVTERTAQDSALAAARRTLAALDTPVPVLERDAGPVHYAAVVQAIAVDTATVDEATDRANEGFAVLHGALCRDGNPPVGPFWSSFGAGDGAGTVEMSLCWPVARPLPVTFAIDAVATRVGTLPARRELVTRWIQAEVEPDPAEDQATHPAVVALLDEVDARGYDLDLTSLRQIGILGEEGPIGVELALSVRPPASVLRIQRVEKGARRGRFPSRRGW